MWVGYDGEVIKQEITLLSSRMTFVRADPQQPTPVNLLPDTSEPLRVPPTGLEDLIESEPLPEQPAIPEPDATPDPGTAPEMSAEPESSP